MYERYCKLKECAHLKRFTYLSILLPLWSLSPTLFLWSCQPCHKILISDTVSYVQINKSYYLITAIESSLIKNSRPGGTVGRAGVP